MSIIASHQWSCSVCGLTSSYYPDADTAITMLIAHVHAFHPGAPMSPLEAARPDLAEAARKVGLAE